MLNVEIASLSSKGQIVIPDKIRKHVGLKKGTKIHVLTDGENILLKAIAEPSIRSFKKIINDSEKITKKAITKRSK
jgi:AbrB family looped-hinge helix DNA binding protein